MSIFKQAKDYIIKMLLGGSTVPSGLVELYRYSRDYGPISFEYKKSEGSTVAISTNFRFGKIITSGKDQDELDRNIKDAILTSFEIPSSFAKEAKIHKLGTGEAGEYAPA